MCFNPQPQCCGQSGDECCNNPIPAPCGECASCIGEHIREREEAESNAMVEVSIVRGRAVATTKVRADLIEAAWPALLPELLAALDLVRTDAPF